MANLLQQYFPMIRTREEVLREIESKEVLRSIFDGWQEEQREEFLDFCTGVRGVKLLYDSFFKEIFNPDVVPERLDEFLSLLMGRKVKVLHVLANDSSRIADECSLVIMDMVVQLQDGSLADLEIQKVGYLFPGARSACYSADLLLRQYKRVRSKKRKRFSYKDIKTVYTIVLFDRSTSAFHKYADTYIHHFKQESDTGLSLNLLQEYFFIPLDIFRKIIHNKNIPTGHPVTHALTGQVRSEAARKGIDTKLKAWFAFLCIDEPEVIVELIERYPEFKVMYEEVYTICQNVERVMGMFSKELQELDRNTVQYMIDEMQETIDRQRKEHIKDKEESEAYKREAEVHKKESEIYKRELEQALKKIKELEEAQK